MRSLPTFAKPEPKIARMVVKAIQHAILGRDKAGRRLGSFLNKRRFFGSIHDAGLAFRQVRSLPGGHGNLQMSRRLSSARCLAQFMLRYPWNR
jgi:hypothetical protein